MEVPSLDEEKVADFDWDRELRVSKRARQALEFMRGNGQVRQGWPTPLAGGTELLALWCV